MISKQVCVYAGLSVIVGNNINPFPNGVSQISAGSNVTISGTLARPVINAVFPTGSVVFYCVNSTGTGFTITASSAFTGTIRYAVLQY